MTSLVDCVKDDTLIGFYLWAYKNVEQVDYIIGRVRDFYPNSDLVISSDNGEDFSKISNKYGAIKYIHGEVSHGFPKDHPLTRRERFGWTSEEAKIWLERIYDACLSIKNPFVMIMEEDVLLQSRFKFPDADIIMMGDSMDGHGIGNPIQSSGMEWIKSRGGRVDHPYYSACGGTIINRLTFVDTYEKNINNFVQEYERVYQECMEEKKKSGWGWPDCILCVLMYAGDDISISTELPIAQVGYDNMDGVPIVHLFKKFYKKVK